MNGSDKIINSKKNKNLENKNKKNKTRKKIKLNKDLQMI